MVVVQQAVTSQYLINIEAIKTVRILFFRGARKHYNGQNKNNVDTHGHRGLDPHWRRGIGLCFLYQRQPDGLRKSFLHVHEDETHKKANKRDRPVRFEPKVPGDVNT